MSRRLNLVWLSSAQGIDASASLILYKHDTGLAFLRVRGDRFRCVSVVCQAVGSIPAASTIYSIT